MNVSNTIKRSIHLAKEQGIGSLINASWTLLYTLPKLSDKVRNKPVWAQIETTNVCNLKCSMCAHSSESWKSEKKPKTLTLDEFKNILDQLPYIRFARISGVGEPLLNPHLPDMIQYANSKGIKTAFFTNGTLLTPDIARRLIHAEGLVNINVSLDAGSPELYEKIRVGATFSDVYNNIKEFIKLRDESGKESPNLSIVTVGMHENVKEIPLLIDTIGPLGVKNFVINNILAADEIQGTPIQAEDFKMLQHVQSSAAKRGIYLSFSESPDGNINRTETRTCVDPWKMVYINTDGSINPCCYSFSHKTADLGNMYTDPIQAIWNDEPFKGFRHELKMGMPKCCQKCPRHSKNIPVTPLSLSTG